MCVLLLFFWALACRLPTPPLFFSSSALPLSLSLSRLHSASTTDDFDRPAPSSHPPLPNVAAPPSRRSTACAPLCVSSPLLLSRPPFLRLRSPHPSPPIPCLPFFVNQSESFPPLPIPRQPFSALIPPLPPPPTDPTVNAPAPFLWAAAAPQCCLLFCAAATMDAPFSLFTSLVFRKHKSNPPSPNPFPKQPHYT